MSNLLEMANVQSILLLHAQGWPQRRIARELGIDRSTVGKYVRQGLCGAKPANAPTGCQDSKPANLRMVPAPGGGTGRAADRRYNRIVGIRTSPCGDRFGVSGRPAEQVPTAS